MRKWYQSILLRIPTALYACAVGVRNFAFDKGLLPSEHFSIPTICVGNLSVGGTGKTPFIEFLIQMLREEYRIAVLSRGYGRKGKAPIIASQEDTAVTIGDEPFQIKRKYPEVMVYIDGNRRRALRAMEGMPDEIRPEVVLMDDGFQHRYVSPAYSIILTPYNRLYTEDQLMPLGRLRESPKEATRADTIIITHTPRDAMQVELRLKREGLNLLAYQDQHFCRLKYDEPVRLFQNEEKAQLPNLTRQTPVVILSGIGTPEHFCNKCTSVFHHVVERLIYPDHHQYDLQDISNLEHILQEHPQSQVITTEKDAMRLLALTPNLSEKVRQSIWYIPISIEMDLSSRIQILRRAKKAIKHNGLTI